MDYDPDFCPLTLEKPTMEQLEKHSWFMCNPCSARRIHERTGGREMVFPNGPPEWAKKPQPPKEVNKSPNEANKPPALAPDRKTRNQKKKEAKDQLFKPAYKDILERMNTKGLNKREATLEMVQDKRKAHQQMIEAGAIAAQEKTKIEKSQMAWIPEKGFIVPGNQLSVFNKVDHKRYVAIVSNLVNRTKTLRYDTNKFELDAMDEALAPERKVYSDYVTTLFKTMKKIPFLHLEFQSRDYLCKRALERHRFLAEKYSKEPVAEVNWPRLPESALVVRPQLVEYLEMGRFRQLKIPDVRRKATFKQDVASVIEKFPILEGEKENRIEKDPLIEEFAREKGVYVAADAGTVRRLFMSKSLCFDEDLAYPVTVKRHLIEGRLVNIAYIGKPVCTNPINKPTLARRYVKLLIKDGLGYLKDNLDAPPPRPELSKYIEQEPSTSTSANGVDDLLGNILGEMRGQDGGDPNREEEDQPISAKGGRTKKKYSVFSFKEDGSPSIIIRSNNDGMEGTQRVSWTHKLEYVPNIGAERIRDEEWLWMFVTNTLKTSQMHLQFRVHYQQFDCLQIERFPNAQNVYNMASPDQKCLIGERTARIANLIDEISKLHVGNYFVQEKDGNMAIFPEYDGDDDEGEEQEDGEGEAEKCIVSANLKPGLHDRPEILPPTDECFNGVDYHLILMWHLIQGRIPGSLPPSDAFAHLKPKPKPWNNANKGKKRNWSGNNNPSNPDEAGPSQPKKKPQQHQHPLFKKWKGNKGPGPSTQAPPIDLDDPKIQTMCDDEYLALVNAISDGSDSDDGFSRSQLKKQQRETPKKEKELVDLISDHSDGEAGQFHPPKPKKSKMKGTQKTLHHFFKSSPSILGGKPSTSKPSTSHGRPNNKRPFKPHVVTVEATPEEVKRYMNNKHRKTPCIAKEVDIKELGDEPCSIERNLQASAERQRNMRAQTMLSNRRTSLFGTPTLAAAKTSHIRIRQTVDMKPDSRRSASPKLDTSPTTPKQNLPTCPLDIPLRPVPERHHSPARAPARVAKSVSPKSSRKSDSPKPSTSAAAAIVDLDVELSASVDSLHLESVEYTLAPDLSHRSDSDIVFVDTRTIGNRGIPPKPFPHYCADDTYGWNDWNNVRLPFSSARLIKDGSLASERVRENLITLTEPQTSIRDVGAAIDKHRPKPLNYDSLYNLFTNYLTPEERMRYLNVVIPNMAKLALRMYELITRPIPYLRSGVAASLTFSQEQVACLMAHSFFCTFPPHRVTTNKNNMQPTNFNSLFSRGRRTKIEKLKCIMHYFDCVTAKMPDGVISIRRNVVPQNVRFGDMTEELCNLVVHEDGRIEDTNNEMLEIDFANEFIGGGVLSEGCVQEEIRFVISPELLVSMLVCEKMDDNESISIVGTQRFCDYQGYGGSFRYVQRTKSGSVIRDRFNRILSEVVAIDAIYFGNPRLQFGPNKIHREITKASCGFAQLDNLNRPIATGNWGCGVFGGDRQLKSLIQLIAASVRGRKDMHYFTFSDAVFTRDLRRVYKALTDNKTTVAQLVGYILGYRDEMESGSTLNLFSYIMQEMALERSVPYKKESESPQEGQMDADE